MREWTGQQEQEGREQQLPPSMSLCSLPLDDVGCSVSNDLIKKIISPGVVVHTFSPSAQEAEADGWISEFKASLVYKMSSRTARATTQRNLVSGRKKKSCFLFLAFSCWLCDKSRLP